MRKKSILITILSIILLITTLVAGLWMAYSIEVRIVNIVTIITAVTGALALYIEFLKNKKIQTANFLIDYSKSFYNCYYDLFECFSELKKHADDPQYRIDIKKYKSKLIVYLQWVEAIASLVERGVLDLYTVDNTLSYRFFLIVNNPDVQKYILIPRQQFYRGTFYLYEKWHKFEESRNLPMPLEETALKNVENYGDIIKEIKIQIK